MVTLGQVLLHQLHEEYSIWQSHGTIPTVLLHAQMADYALITPVQPCTSRVLVVFTQQFHQVSAWGTSLLPLLEMMYMHPISEMTACFLSSCLQG